jgi:hypothetical protein
MNVQAAIHNADAILPGKAATEGQPDPRWQAIIAIADYLQTDPEPIWTFCERWGQSEDADLRAAIATCLLEHLLEYHHDLIERRVEQLASTNRQFAETAAMCWGIRHETASDTI